MPTTRTSPAAFFLPAGIGLLLLCLLFSCSKTDETDRIRQMIAEAAIKAESHDIAGVMAHAADGFTADPGGYNERSVRGVLFWAFKHYGEFRVLFPEPRVDIAPDGRNADAGVIFVIMKKQGLIPDLDELYRDPQRWVEQLGDAADLYRLDLSLVKGGGGWQVGYAELSPYG